jgi:hypothetical protein
MFGSDIGKRAEHFSRGVRELVPHCQRIIPVSSNAKVRMVPHDRARVTRVPTASDRFRKRVRNCLPLRGIDPERFKLQEWIRALVKVFDLLLWWRWELFTGTDWSHIFKFIFAHFR